MEGSSGNIVPELLGINDLIIDFLQTNGSPSEEKIELLDVNAPAIVQILKKGVETIISLKGIPAKMLSSTGIQAY